jgi:hypothetical protein
MKQEKDWLDYGNLIVTALTFCATVLIAIFVQGASDKADHAKNIATHYQVCYDNQFKLEEALCQDKDCAPPNSNRLRQLGYFYSQVKQFCEVADKDLRIDVSPELNTFLTGAAHGASADTPLEARAAAIQLTGVNVFEPVANAHVTPLPVSKLASSNLYPRSDPLLFVQISSPDQIPAATALIHSTDGLPFMSGKLHVVGPDPHYVPVKQTQIRCSKASDCVHAKELAIYVGSVLNQPVAVYDFSAQYGDTMRKFGPRFELWIAPGAITANSTK